MPRSATEKLEMILDRLFEGRCIPFVGAGISMNAEIPGDDRFRPTLSFMRESLACALRNHLSGRSEDSPFCAVLPRAAGGAATSSLDATSFDQVADVADWLFGRECLCRAVCVQRFAHLEPLPTHRYIAYLAREGLLTEVISTNYDCCIEKAHARSFGPMDSFRDSALKTVWSQDSYRNTARVT